LADEKSYNVVGEIKGTEYPEEIILVGGHLDSWDVGEGAHDDGTGVVQSMEVLRIIKALSLKPKRTIRAVLFMNEENGVKGGEKYGELAIKNKENHIAAIESDEGGHTPRGFNFQEDGSKFHKWLKLFAPYSVHEMNIGYGGTDIQPLSPTGSLLIAYKPDSQRYFDYHHTNNDTFDKVNKRELELGAATMASLVYLFSEYGVK
ncbi:MAG: M20/M25/M40 family metallo-hydrolase, partial [Cytophagales bacterium]|nr:M20/M25/M40 family metallo-hydrolase [Cytophagales bacterium]